MFRNHRRSLRIAAVILAALTQTSSGQTLATSPGQTLAISRVPPELQVPVGHIAFLKGHAVGTQNYVCLPTASGLAWRFQGPQATVFLTYQWIRGEVRQQIMTHFLSPNPAEPDQPARATWQSSTDTSSVWAKKIAESSDPAWVAPGAIPWFLLQSAGVQRGPTGGAMLARTTYIQRVNTTGGVVIQTACSEAGAIQFVPYTADYVFYERVESR